MVLILGLAAVVFFVLAGLNIGGARFNPGWFGIGCATIAILWPALEALGG